MEPDHWLVPDWPAPTRVRAACSTRSGGVSAGSYASFNLGDHVADEPAAVAENRRRFAAALGARPVFLQQVHGTGVVRLDRGSRDGAAADACWTGEEGIACTIMVADCLPVLMTDRQGRVVGAAHCGWRGLAGVDGTGALETLWSSLWPRVASSEGAAARDMLVWLGPCIGPAAFEVGADVKAAFEAAQPDAARRFEQSAGGKWLADLPGLARDRLQALGLVHAWGNDGSAAWCTVGNPSRFFSHRRDRVSGRFAAAIWLA
ncbi:MAG TPA: peptidoglycan editing factor PgeF [Ramlibacter sp.]|jgi:YfiH family protein|uniref:peptidoglycan editing factor PgeF n=1 Tax=Ramlibacter sp. TaxID=1917967 RepID=UPI002D6A9E77|nr:peptidoglycan editing factor PgeF [Ramlibacter sp.]HZY19288.1 peptidoglycan editing factor PgeF [Ramlibacter sp.]